MEAVIAKGPLNFDNVQDHPIPELQSDLDVLVKVSCVGICASDGKMFKGSSLYWDPVSGRA